MNTITMPPENKKVFISMRYIVIFLLIVFSVPARATPDPSTPDSKVIKAMFEQDQLSRETSAIDWKTLTSEDRARRLQLKQIMSTGGLKTGMDYYRASFIEQHGQAPDDYLLAHVLANVAMALGVKKAAWISAATLDRYLQTSGRPQIFGTQSRVSMDPNGNSKGKDTMEPYNSSLISDNIRKAMNVMDFQTRKKNLAEGDYSSAINEN